tara:strand:- start:6350 stop:6709 length:360 start_codon:yes stop_codon:yes gene_type:complete
MSLPLDIVNEIFSWIDVSFLYHDVYNINYDVAEKFRVAYFTSTVIGRATKQLFLKKKKLFEQYSLQYMIYKNISLTNILYYMLDKHKNTFDYKDINLMLIVHKINTGGNLGSPYLNKGL